MTLGIARRREDAAAAGLLAPSRAKVSVCSVPWWCRRGQKGHNAGKRGTGFCDSCATARYELASRWEKQNEALKERHLSSFFLAAETAIRSGRPVTRKRHEQAALYQPCFWHATRTKHGRLSARSPQTPSRGNTYLLHPWISPPVKCPRSPTSQHHCTSVTTAKRRPDCRPALIVAAAP